MDQPSTRDDVFVIAVVLAIVAVLVAVGFGLRDADERAAECPMPAKPRQAGAGTYDFVCDVHPAQMKGELTVGEASP